MTDTAVPGAFPEGILRPACDIISTEVEDEVMLFAPETSRYVGLTGAATRVWNLVEERAHSAEQIAQILFDEFDADPAKIRADLARTLADLTAHRLITSD
jgi:hypothetical protein